MANLEPPVLTDPETRKHYDQTWALFPYEHPQAYWLRGGLYGLVCTRCGHTMAATAEEHELFAFVSKHLGCPLGHGFDSRGVVAHDPLFEEATDVPAPDDSGPAGSRG